MKCICQFFLIACRVHCRDSQMKSVFKSNQALHKKSGFDCDDVNQLVAAEESTWENLLKVSCILTHSSFLTVRLLLRLPRARSERSER
jgi:hypothetical protein